VDENISKIYITEKQAFGWCLNVKISGRRKKLFAD
jgi:hypothetical protein